jgi:hypothetical protein
MTSMLLYDTLAAAKFEPGEAGRNALQVFLDDCFKNTLVTSPNSVSDIRLNPRTKKTLTDRRYTSTALFAVCRVCAPGLSGVVTHLAGDARPNDRRRDLFSVETACNVFNQVVDLRFGSMLSQCRLVVDERYNRIDGVLGPRTHYLENSTFVELVESILVDAADVTFAGATAIGRKLFLRYHEPDVITTLDGPYRRGFAFFVSEAGDDSIRPYRLYERVADGGTCLQVPSIRRSRQKRTGSKFAAKLRQMLVSVLQSEPCDIAAEIEAMHDSHVFTDDFSSEGVQSVVRSWRRRLRLGGVPSDIADGIASSPFGYDNSEASPLSDTVLASKTEYDLFRAAIADATTRGQRVRELVERAAFSVFIQDKQ